MTDRLTKNPPQDDSLDDAELVPADDTIIGVAEGTDDLGNLLLRQDDGTLLTLTAGDVTLSQTGHRGDVESLPPRTGEG